MIFVIGWAGGNLLDWIGIRFITHDKTILLILRPIIEDVSEIDMAQILWLVISFFIAPRVTAIPFKYFGRKHVG